MPAARRPPARRRGPRGPGSDSGALRLFATAVPGLGPLLRRELTAAGFRVQGTGSDGRADVVLFESDTRTVPQVHSAEDVFCEVGRTLRSEGDRAPWIARRLWRASRVEQALSLRPAKAQATYRVIARVLQERSFKRTELRRHLTGVVGADRPRWRSADPAALEVWALEYATGKFVAGLRLSDAGMRQHDGRAVERAGALRPTVAAAMLDLTGASGRVTVLDPCCGSGTVLSEATARGWTAIGRDIDADAVATARTNVPAAQVARGDARDLDLADASVECCVSNLPFGQQYAVPGDPGQWLSAVCRELARVTRPGGRIVLLSPTLPRSSVPDPMRLVERHPIRLLGTRTTIWVYDVAARSPGA